MSGIRTLLLRRSNLILANKNMSYVEDAYVWVGPFIPLSEIKEAALEESARGWDCERPKHRNGLTVSLHILIRKEHTSICILSIKDTVGELIFHLPDSPLPYGNAKRGVEDDHFLLF